MRLSLHLGLGPDIEHFRPILLYLCLSTTQEIEAL
jgi:hypothetical protein